LDLNRKVKENKTMATIKLKNILNESAPGFENRKWGDALPTAAEIQKAYQAKNNITEDTEPLNEEYIEVMKDLDDGLALIKDSWLEWKNGPMTEKSDIKPAQKELMKYIADWMKKNIK
tara:strand:+ start:829 stop:1182 length:354 start_codon:yes stop_codon:yes gene_type:complete